MAAFAAYARPTFHRGQSWTYVPLARWVTVGADGDTGWFDEWLDNATLNDSRTPGVHGV